ncbi:MAG TPA: carbon monoxide dehydrogenase subunit G [Marmoricola sp.]|nr:carbon monoxide dehydrogenase subunit G [Marmoricola sp.]
MRIAGEATLQAPLEAVWDALLDPAVLVRTIPGCERLETVGENSYTMTVTVGVAAIRGTYAGACTITDLHPRESLKLKAEGAGAPGTIAADVDVRFSANDDGTTTLHYDAETVVGGMIGGVGQRMLSSVSRRLAGEFFLAIEKVLMGGPVPAAEAPAAEPPAAGVFTAPAKAAPVSSQREFLTGVAVGAGLVALGVALGAVAGRRR